MSELSGLARNAQKSLDFMNTITYIMQQIYYITKIIHYISSIHKKMKRRIKFKLARIENDLTQEELARKAGVTRQTIGLIENGRYNPTLNLCIAIAKALNKTLDELFWEVENE